MNHQNHIIQSSRWVYLLFSIFAFVLYDVGSVQAHANLVQAQPTAGSVLAESPTVVVLDFSEDLDARATTVEMRDGQSRVVVAGPGIVNPTNLKRLQLTLPALPDGTYSAIWQARSAIDGHITKGTVAFSVGIDALPPSLLPPLGTPEPATAWPAAADSLLRWLNYLAAAVAVGSLLFGWLVWRPAYKHWQASTLTNDSYITAILQRLALSGSGIWAVMTLLFIVVQASQLDSSSLWVGIEIIVAGRSGLLAGMRLGLLFLLILSVRRLPLAGNGRLISWLFPSILGAVGLLTFSLQSHSAALPGGQALLAIVFDWLHLLAMTAWLGGLLPLIFTMWYGRSLPGLTAVLIPRFSKVALPCVAILILTGLYSSLIHVRTIEALITTTYGRALSLKLGLFCLLLAFGAVNLLLLTPQLRKAEAVAAQRLRQTVRLELMVGTVVLLAVGVMTGVAPAFEALEAQHRLGFRESVRVEDVQLVLHIAPLQIGNNEFAVDVNDERSGAVQVEPQVLLRFRSENEEMGVLQVETHSEDGKRYLASGAYLSVVGKWQVEVILRRDGFDDVKQTFDLSIESNNHQHG